LADVHLKTVAAEAADQLRNTADIDPGASMAKPLNWRSGSDGGLSRARWTKREVLLKKCGGRCRLPGAAKHT